MAAPVRVEDKAFSDPRIELLGVLAGYNRYEALGRLTHLWHTCTERNQHVVSEGIVVACLGEKGVAAIVESELGERVEGGIRVCGTKGRIEWLAKARKNGKKGGRPKKPHPKPSGLDSAENPARPDNPPAPAADLSPSTPRSTGTDNCSRARAALDEFYPDVARPELAAQLVADHPRIDVAAEIRRARRWEADHPDKPRQHKPSFLRTWMGNAEAKAAETPAQVGYHPGSTTFGEGDQAI